jgi:hypothetical protein
VPLECPETPEFLDQQKLEAQEWADAERPASVPQALEQMEPLGQPETATS